MKCNKRNGTIDFLRFVFCLVVLLFHITNDMHSVGKTGGVFRLGGLSVEFFFIVSGFYMTSTINKRKSDYDTAWRFVKHKIYPVLPYHIVFNATVITGSIFLNHRGFEEVLNKMSSFFFLPVVGFNNYQWALGAEWYIGCMLFAMLVIYPFLKLYYNFFTTYFAPILSIILLGYLSSHYSSVIDANRLIRSFTGIFLGITSYVVSQKLNNIKLNRIKLIVSLYPLITMILFLIYMNTKLDNSIQPIAVLIMWTAMIVIFTEKGIVTSTGLLNCKFIYLLGKYSLPIYLIQNITRNICEIVLHGFGNRLYPTVAFITTIIGGIVSYHVCSFIKSYVDKKTHKSQRHKEKL